MFPVIFELDLAVFSKKKKTKKNTHTQIQKKQDTYQWETWQKMHSFITNA